MNDLKNISVPKSYEALTEKCKQIGFTMPSDIYIGSLLKTLIASRPGGNFLELGTGIGLSLSWMIEGMDEQSKLISIDNDPELISIANEHFGLNPQVKIICEDGSKWITENSNLKFDLIFADAWPGKYSEVDEILDMLKTGGFYVIDDMNPQANWPEGHSENVDSLIEYLENRNDLVLTKMNWSTGIVLAVKK